MKKEGGFLPEPAKEKKYYRLNSGEVPEELVDLFHFSRMLHNRRYLRIVSVFGLFAGILLSIRRLFFDNQPGAAQLQRLYLLNFLILVLISLIYLLLSFILRKQRLPQNVRYWQRFYMTVTVVNYSLLTWIELQSSPDFTAVAMVILFLSVTMWVDSLSYLIILLIINLVVGAGYYSGVHVSVTAPELITEMLLFSIIGTVVFYAVGNSRMSNFVNEHLLRKTIAELKDLSLRDPLTRLYNRRMMNEELERELSLSRRTRLTLTIILIDLDRFKRVNDSLGHSSGDEVLIQTAGILGSLVRASDTVFRFGGEEFLILLPNTTLEGAECIAERVVSNFRQEKFTGVPWTITVSMGLADNSERHLAADLIKLADSRLYVAKDTGRDRWVAQGCNEDNQAGIPFIPDL